MEALWQFDQHIKNKEVSFGGQQITFNVEICIINQRLEVEETNALYVTPCGTYHGEDIGLEPCRLRFQDDQCRSENTPSVCQDWDLNGQGCDVTRFTPGDNPRATSYCYIGKTAAGEQDPKYTDACATTAQNEAGNMFSTVCSDAKAHAQDDGTIHWWSEIACHKQITGRTILGSFHDQAPEEMWCAFDSTISYFGVLDYMVESILKFGSMDRKDDFNLVTKVFEGAFCYSVAGKFCVDWENAAQKRGVSPYSLQGYMFLFHSQDVAAVLLNSIFLTGTIKDIRALKDCPMSQTAVCPDIAVPAPPAEVTVSASCSDDDAALQATLKGLKIENSLVTCAEAASNGWCSNELGSTCLDVRNSCPKSCKNADYPGCAPSRRAEDEVEGEIEAEGEDEIEDQAGDEDGRDDENEDENEGEGEGEIERRAEDAPALPCLAPFPQVPFINPAAMSCECDYPSSPSKLKNPSGYHLWQTYRMEDCETMLFIYALRKECNLDSPTLSKIKGYGDRKWVDCSYDNTDFCGCRGEAGCQEECRKKKTQPNAYEPCEEGDAMGDCECPAMQLERCESNKSVCGNKNQCKNLKSEPCGDEDLVCLCRKFMVPELKHRKKWVAEIISELSDAYQSTEDDALVHERFGTTIPAEGSIYKVLYDKGIDVGVANADFIGHEVIRVIAAETWPIVGTFALMIVFLALSISITGWKGWVPEINVFRVGLSMLVILQPIIAQLMAWGIGFIPMWQVPGDVDLDGESDDMLPITFLSPLSLHLMLAIIVDLDIILVRSFDRTPADAPFSKRLEASIGNCHRTIAISTVTGLLAFAMGSVIDMEILIFFCWHAFLGYLGLYITLFTLFLGAFVLTEDLGGGQPKDQESTEITSEVKTGDPAELETVKWESDAKFANFLMHPAVVIPMTLFEVTLMILSIVFIPEITTEVDLQDNLLEDSVLVRTIKHLVDAGGTSQKMSLWMPGSDRGEYHKQANRDYYFEKFEEIRALDSVTPVGKPGTNSWIHDFEVWHKVGRYPTDYFGFWSVPAANICPYDYTIAYHATSTFTSASDGDLVGGTLTTDRSSLSLDDLFAMMTRNRKFYLHTGDETAEGLPITLEIAQIVKPQTGGGANFHEDILLSIDPRTESERLRNYNTPEELKAYLSTQFPFIIHWRDIAEHKYVLVPNLAIKMLKCAAHQSYYEQRIQYHESHPEDFYEYLHDWFYESDYTLVSCAVSELNKGKTRMGKKNKYKTLEGKPGQCALVVPSPIPQNYEKFSPTNQKTVVVRDGWTCADECDNHIPDAAPDDGVCRAYSHSNATKACILHIVGRLEKINHRTPVPNTGTEDWICHIKVQSPQASRFFPANAGKIEWKYDSATLAVTGIKDNYLEVFCTLDVTNMVYTKRQRDETRALVDKWRKDNPERWPVPSEEPLLDTFVHAPRFLWVEKDEGMLPTLLDHYIKVGIAVVVASMFFLHPLYGIAIGIFLALINAQVLAFMGMIGMPLEVLTFGTLAMAIGFGIEYVVHIAHSFVHMKSRGLQRTRDCLEDMGITVFNAFLSTAVQQIVFLIFASTGGIVRYCTLMVIVIVKSGLTGFFFVPLVLGTIDELVHRHQLKYAGGDAYKTKELQESKTSS